MAIRTILTKGDPALNKMCHPVTKFDQKLWELLDDLKETLAKANGLGLAAPQVGIVRRMFVAEPEPGEVYFFVNTKITAREGQQESEEGCLSLPGYVGLVDRPEKITIEGLDRDGNHQKYDFEGFSAIVMCHEYDHLDGILYKDRAKEMYEVTENAENMGDEA